MIRKVSFAFLIAGIFMMLAGDLLWLPFGANYTFLPLKIISWSKLYLLLFMASFLLYIAQGLAWPIGRASRTLFFPILLLSFVFMFSVLFSQDKSSSLKAAATFFMILFIAHMLSVMMDDPDLLDLLWNTCASAMLYLALKVIVWRLSEGLHDGTYLVMNNSWVGKLQIAWVLNLCAPFLFVRTIQNRGWKSALSGLAWALSGTAIFILFSRTGTVMFLLSAFLICIFHMDRWKKTVPLAIAMSLGIIFAGVVSPRMSRYVIKSYAQLFEEPGMVRRYIIWKDTLRMFKDHPITGTGLGTYDEIAYSQYGAPYDRISDQKFRRGGWHAHNVHLHILAETGILGFGAWIYFLFCLTAIGISTWRKNKTPQSRSLAQASLLCLFCFLALSMTENLLAMRVHQSLRMNLTLAFLALLSLAAIQKAERGAFSNPRMSLK